MDTNKEKINNHTPYCHFCGGKIGETSERTDEEIHLIFDCEKCNFNYCDQCSYETIEKNKHVQKCLKCNNIIYKVN